MSFRNDIRMAMAGTQGPVIQLIVINVAIFLFLNVARVFFGFLLNMPDVVGFIQSLFVMPADLGTLLTRFWTPVLYGFSHEGFLHILFNMLWLYWFGRIFLVFLDSKKLINAYVLGVLAGGLAYLVLYNLSPRYDPTTSNMIGASAGVYAVVVATATLSPNYQINLIFLGPVKIVYIALFMVVVMSLFALGRGNDGGNFAHLGGAAMGFFYIRALRGGTDLGAPVQGVIRFFKGLFTPQPKIRVSQGGGSKPKAKPGSDSSQDEIDAILDKISDKGYDSLTKEEKRKLFEASKK